MATCWRRLSAHSLPAKTKCDSANCGVVRMFFDDGRRDGYVTGVLSGRSTSIDECRSSQLVAAGEQLEEGVSNHQ